MLVAFHARVQPGQPLFQLLIELADEDLGVAGMVQGCGLRFVFAGKSTRSSFDRSRCRIADRTHIS